MAVTMTLTCDYKNCSQPATETLELKFQDVAYRADVCEGHVDEMQAAIGKLGFRPIAGLVGGKRRELHVTKSGEPFTTAQARAWLIDQGLKDNSNKGRVSAEHLELYAANH